MKNRCSVLSLTILAMSALLSQPVGATGVPSTGGLQFEQNVGQSPSEVRYSANGRDNVVFLTRSGISLKLGGATKAPLAGTTTEMMHFSLVNVAQNVTLNGLERLTGVSNYFVGDNPDDWHTGVPHFSRVRYSRAYPGTDVVVYGRDGQLEYDFVLAPGANPAMVRIRVDGAKSVGLDAEGNLVLQSPLGRRVLQHRPVVYQNTTDGQIPVEAAFDVFEDGTVGFDIGAYDTSRELVIDPVVSWATYLGGRDRDEMHAVAVDGAGNVYVTGASLSDDFPMENPYQTTQTVYTTTVTKFNAAGDTLLYSTFVGGSGNEYGNGIVVDATGGAYVVGRTFSTNFPTVNAYQSTSGGNSDAFVFKLSPAGNDLEFSTYLGGDSKDFGHGIALDSGGHICVTGETQSENFPTRSALQSSHGGGRLDAFVSKLNANGSSLVYSTFLGGRSDDMGYAIAVMPNGTVFVGGETASNDFPTLSAYQATHAGGQDAFVAKISSGGVLSYSTYLGGSGHERTLGVAVNQAGKAIAVGRTGSHTFPTENAIQGEIAGSWDGFISRLSSSGQSLDFGSFFGGSGHDEIAAITLDGNGDFYLAGFTKSSDFPVHNPNQGAWGGNSDAFTSIIDGTLLSIVYSSYLGGSDIDSGSGVAVDASGNIHLCGLTQSVDFPTLNPFQNALDGGESGFVAKIRGNGQAQGYSYIVPALAHATGAGGTNWRSNVAAVNAGGAPASMTMTFMGTGQPRVRNATLASGSTREWSDILVSLFGFAQSDSVSGSLQVTSNQPLRISTRTFNAPGTGTYGQYLPALSAGDAVSAGVVGIVPMMQKSNAFRTNLGAQNISDVNCQVRYSLFNSNGQQVGQNVTRNIAALRWDQVSDIFAAAGAGTQSLAYAKVEVLTAGAEVWFYASLVDNTTGDGTTIPVLW